MAKDTVIRAQVIPVWQPAFLAELENTGNLSAACRAANIKMATVSTRRQIDSDFNRRVQELLRQRKLGRDPNDILVPATGTPFAWDEPWPEDDEYTSGQAFLMILGRTLNPSAACKAVGVSYSAYRNKRESDPEFDKLCRLAINRACDELEGALYQRALDESDAAAVTMLRAHRSEVYKVTDRAAPGTQPEAPTTFYLPEKEDARN